MLGDAISGVLGVDPRAYYAEQAADCLNDAERCRIDGMHDLADQFTAIAHRWLAYGERPLGEILLCAS